MRYFTYFSVLALKPGVYFTANSNELNQEWLHLKRSIATCCERLPFWTVQLIHYKHLEGMNYVFCFATSVIIWICIFYFLPSLYSVAIKCKFISIKRKPNKAKPENPVIMLQAICSLTICILPELHIGLKQKADIWGFLKA